MKPNTMVESRGKYKVVICHFLWIPFLMLQNSLVAQTVQEQTSSYEKVKGLLTACEELYLSDIDTLLVLGQEGLEILEGEGQENRLHIELKAGLYNVLGFYYENKGGVQQSIECYRKSLDLSVCIDDKKMQSDNHNNLAGIYLDLGALEKSLEHYNAGLSISLELDIPKDVASIYDNMSFLYQSQKNYDKTLEFRKKALKIRERINDEEGIALSWNNMAIVFAKSGDLSKAKLYYKKALALNRKIKNLFGVAGNLDNVGSAFMLEGSIDSAIYYYTEGLNLFEELERPEGICNSHISLGMVYLKSEDLDEAQIHSEEAYFLARMLQYPNLIRVSAELLSQIYEKKGDATSSYRFYKEFKQIEDSLESYSIQKKMAYQEAHFDFLNEQKIAKIETDKKIAMNELNSKRKRQIYIVLIVLLLCVILSGFFFYRQKRKLITSRLEISELKKKELESELVLKQRELVSFSIRLTQNNQYITRINEITEELRFKMDKMSNMDPLEEMLGDLKRSIKESARLDKDWTNFQKQFDGVHAEFSKRLKQEYPKLSGHEIRLCTLMKLNLSTSEIAMILNVSTNTLSSARYRIHKKMSIDRGVRLQDYILDF